MCSEDGITLSVDTGAFTSIGPAVDHTVDHECCSAEVCRIADIHGNQLSDTDAFLLLNACGLWGVPEGQISSVVSPSGTTGTFVEWPVLLSTACGVYR